MLFTVSNAACDNTNKFTDATHFTNRLPFTIVTDEFMKHGQPIHYIRLEGISINPWPNKTLLICCNFCERQPYGQNMQNVLAMTYGVEKFTRPRVPVQKVRSREIEIELKSIDGTPINADTVTVQLSINEM